MSELIVVSVNGESRIDSRLVARSLGIEHHNLMGTIRKYQARVEKFGILPFQTEEIKGRGQPGKLALLNENQAVFVANLSRNTEQVVEFKFNLTVAFSEARKGLTRQPVSQATFELFEDAKLLRTAIEDLEDKQLSIRKMLQFLKYGEELRYPSQVRSRGKRKVSPIRIGWMGQEVQQMLLTFEDIA